MRYYEIILESWNHYTGIGHKKGALVYYMMPGGEIESHEYNTRRDNHDSSGDGPEGRAIAVGRIDIARKKISVRTPLVPGNSFFMISQSKLNFIRKRLERNYPDYQIWYFGHGASEIRRIDRNQ